MTEILALITGLALMSVHKEFKSLEGVRRNRDQESRSSLKCSLNFIILMRARETMPGLLLVHMIS